MGEEDCFDRNWIFLPLSHKEKRVFLVFMFLCFVAFICQSKYRRRAQTSTEEGHKVKRKSYRYAKLHKLD